MIFTPVVQLENRQKIIQRSYRRTFPSNCPFFLGLLVGRHWATCCLKVAPHEHIIIMSSRLVKYIKIRLHPPNPLDFKTHIFLFDQFIILLAFCSFLVLSDGEIRYRDHVLVTFSHFQGRCFSYFQSLD